MWDTEWGGGGGPAYLNWESLWSEAESLRSHCSNLERKEAPRGNCGEGWLGRWCSQELVSLAPGGGQDYMKPTEEAGCDVRMSYSRNPSLSALQIMVPKIKSQNQRSLFEKRGKKSDW